jgi:hypothetical protein
MACYLSSTAQFYSRALTIEADEDLLFSLSELMQINGIWEDGAEE